MIRPLMIAALSVTLAACQPKPAAPVESETPATEAVPEVEAAAADRWSAASDDAGFSITSQESADTEPFTLTCSIAGKKLIAGAGVEEVHFSNMAYPYKVLFSGTPFDADLVPGLDSTPRFEVSAPITPDLLAALRDTQTARIVVNDGYAFAESAVDDRDIFETFVADCATATGIAPAP